MRRFVERLAIAFLLLSTAPAFSQTTHSIDIGPGPLGEVISQLGVQTETSIGTTDTEIARRKVRRVQGRMTTEAALRKLLRGQDARAIRINAEHWRIERTIAAPIKAVLQPPLEAAQIVSPEIIVTASKRHQRLSRFPGSASVIDVSAYAFSANHGGSDTLIANSVSLTSTNVGDGRNKLFIRGVVDASFIGSQQATVGQYFGDMRLNYNAPDPDLRLIDVRSVEILEGPQGTLYGAGSLGGIIRADANAPRLGNFEGEMGVSGSLTAHGAPSGDLFAVANIPILTDRLGIRLVGYAGHQGGYIDDQSRGIKDVNDSSNAGGRAMIRANLAPDWIADLTLIGQSAHSDDSQYAERLRPRLTRKSVTAQGHSNTYGLANLHLSGRIGDIRLVSSTGIVRHRLVEDYDGSTTFGLKSQFRQHNKLAQFTTENRLSRDYDSGAGWMIGASYLESSSEVTRSLKVEDFNVYTFGTDNHLSEWAAFGEATIPLTDWAQLTAGGRVSISRLRSATIWPGIALVSQDYQHRSETVLLPSLGMMTSPAERLGAFLRYQQGFRPGGVALDGFNVEPFRNDRMAAYEFGVRYGDVDQDVFAATGSLSFTNWKNIQAGVFTEGSEPVLLNIGNGRIYSAQARIIARPTPQLSIDMSVIYTHARVTQPNAIVVRLIESNFVTIYEPGETGPLVPQPSAIGDVPPANDPISAVGTPIGVSRLLLPSASGPSALVAVNYEVALAARTHLLLRANARYVGKARLDISPAVQPEQGGYFDTELLARLRMGRTSFYVDVQNVLDTLGNRFGAGAPYALFTGNQFTPLRPRTITIGVERSF